MDGDDQAWVVQCDYHPATLARDEPTVARVAPLIEIFFERIFDNRFRFFSRSLDPT
jgi:hypothetical protein